MANIDIESSMHPFTKTVSHGETVPGLNVLAQTGRTGEEVRVGALSPDMVYLRGETGQVLLEPEDEDGRNVYPLQLGYRTACALELAEVIPDGGAVAALDLGMDHRPRTQIGRNGLDLEIMGSDGKAYPIQPEYALLFIQAASGT